MNIYLLSASCTFFEFFVFPIRRERGSYLRKSKPMYISYVCPTSQEQKVRKAGVRLQMRRLPIHNTNNQFPTIVHPSCLIITPPRMPNIIYSRSTSTSFAASFINSERNRHYNIRNSNLCRNPNLCRTSQEQEARNAEVRLQMESLREMQVRLQPIMQYCY